MQRYFEADVHIDDPVPGQWSAEVTLGSLETIDDPAELEFSIQPVLVDEELATYLSTMHHFESDGESWWSSENWPPNAIDLRPIVRVQRSPECAAA